MTRMLGAGLPDWLRISIIYVACTVIAPAAFAATVTPELQRTIRENTFEVVTKKPPDEAQVPKASTYFGSIICS